LLSRQYVRAKYDPNRGSYVSTEAEWIDGEPSVEYHFIAQEDEDKLGIWQGGLEKFWCDEDENWYGEFFVIGEYKSESDFDADVAQILREARAVSVKENVDEFLAVTDIVKRRAVQIGYEDNTIEDLEGLFQDGPEDGSLPSTWGINQERHSGSLSSS